MNRPGYTTLLRRLACRDCKREIVDSRGAGTYPCVWCNRDTEHVPAPRPTGGPAKRVDLL